MGRLCVRLERRSAGVEIVYSILNSVVSFHARVVLESLAIVCVSSCFFLARVRGKKNTRAYTKRRVHK